MDFYDICIPNPLSRTNFSCSRFASTDRHEDYPSDVQIYFKQDGKYAEGAVALRGLVAITTSYFVMRETPTIYNIDALIGLQTVITLLFIFAKNVSFKFYKAYFMEYFSI